MAQVKIEKQDRVVKIGRGFKIPFQVSESCPKEAFFLIPRRRHGSEMNPPKVGWEMDEELARRSVKVTGVGTK
jgi:hypothetical protein